MASSSLLRKIKKYYWRARARALAIMFHMSRHVHHSGYQPPTPQKSEEKRSKTQKLDARLGRLRGRGQGRRRERDEGVKRSAKEEQLWKIKADTLKEKSRHRKQESMDRWKVAATTSGAFRGV